jgi:hypothetical protein
MRGSGWCGKLLGILGQLRRTGKAWALLPAHQRYRRDRPGAALPIDDPARRKAEIQVRFSH